tara:strand:+ start:164 stop:412 length:249 start_codon:yes stop_codon:yes gene_type:complete
MINNYYFNKFRVEFFKISGFICFTPTGIAFLEIYIYSNKEFSDYINIRGLMIIVSIILGLMCFSKAIETCEIMDKGGKAYGK